MKKLVLKKSILILCVVLAVVLIGCTSEEAKPKPAVTPTMTPTPTPTLVTPTPVYTRTPVSTPTPTSSTQIKYHIAKLEDISFSNIKRYRISAVIEEQVTPEQMKSVAKAIVEGFKKDHEFNTLVVFLYDYDEYVGDIYTLGRVIYAPDGDFAKAKYVETGDYSKMSYSFELMNKDWSLRLTPDEVKVWKAWQDAYFAQQNPDEEKITAEIAKKFGLTTDQVNSILTKQTLWTVSDLNSQTQSPTPTPTSTPTSTPTPTPTPKIPLTEEDKSFLSWLNDTQSKIEEDVGDIKSALKKNDYTALELAGHTLYLHAKIAQSEIYNFDVSDELYSLKISYSMALSDYRSAGFSFELGGEYQDQDEINDGITSLKKASQDMEEVSYYLSEIYGS